MSRIAEMALDALQEIAGKRPVASSQPQCDLLSNTPCGSPHCGGCYPIGDGRYIHPPKPSSEWLDWLSRWTPKEGAKGQ